MRRRRRRAAVESDQRIITVVAQLSLHTAGYRADVLGAGLAERPSAFLPPALASTADVGVDVDVPRALAHAAGGGSCLIRATYSSSWGGRMGEKDEKHEANLY